MNIGAISVIVTIALAVTGYFLTYWNNLRLSRHQAHLALVNQQLNEFYGPLFIITRTISTAYQAQLSKTGRSQVYEEGKKLTQQEWEENYAWVVAVYAPLEDQLSDLIIHKAHLLREQRIPESLLTLVAHVSVTKALIHKWMKDDFSEVYPAIEFPPELEAAAGVAREQRTMHTRVLQLSPHVGRWPVTREEPIPATLRTLALAGLFLGLGTSLASAQHPQIREGFWISAGLGYGSAHLTCDSCTKTTVGGVAGFIRLGGTLKPNLRLGGEIDGWTHNYPATATLPSANEVVSNVTAAVYLYPMPASGFFLKGGLGISNYYFTCCGGSVTGTGAGFIAGLGYDIRVRRNFSVTPTGDLWYGRVGDVKSAGLLQGTGWKQAVVSFGLGATFH